MKWWHISIILCAYGFLKEFRPSEPFISPYLTTFKNFTIKQVNEEMFPVGTYSYLFLLVIIFLLTDFLRYKPVLLAGSISGVITWSLLLWGTTMIEMQTVEFFYGLFLATEIAYYAYIYAKVDKKHYQKVTSHTRAAILLGKAVAGLSSQFLVFLKINYLQLNYFSIFGVGATIPVVLFLPNVPQSIYFHPRKTEAVPAEPESRCHSSKETVWSDKANDLENVQFSVQQWKTAFVRLFVDFKQAFSNTYVLKWSVWWALATCGYLQAISYCQLLWQNIIQEDKSTLYHGYVEFAFAVTSAVAAFGVGFLNIDWKTWGETFLGILTVCQGGLLFYSAYLFNLYTAYAVFIVYRNLYEAAITIATYEIAKFINEDSYALVFGVNTFTALIFQAVLTAIVLQFLEINIRHQYLIYGGYHFAVGCAFLIYGILRFIILRIKTVKI